MFVRFLVLAAALLSFSGYAKSKSTVHGYLGYGPGGLGFGADYEMKWDKHTKWGVYLHNYSASDNGNGGMGIGGYFRPVFKRGPYLYRMTLGAGIFNIQYPIADSDSTFGTMMGLGISKKFTKKVSLGFDAFSYYGWFSSPSGKVFESMMFSAGYRL